MDSFPTPLAMMAADLAGTLAGAALLAGMFLFPGWVAGWAGDLLGFRAASPMRRTALALGISVCLSPILAYLLVRTGSFWPAWIVFGALSLAGAVLAPRKVATRPALVLGAVAWVALCHGLMAEIATGDGLITSTLIADYVKHVAVTDAIARTGVPPANPALFPGHPLPLFYYYLWFIPCALADRLGGALVDARQAVYAGTLWIGPIMAAVLALWVGRLAPRLGGKAAYGTAILLLLVTGLDLIPNVWLGILFAQGTGPGIGGDLEWWNEQVSSWLFSLIWVPHHMAAFAAVMMAFLLLLDREGRRPAAILTAGAGFASAAGMSVWVTLTAVAIVAAWAGPRLLRGGWRAAWPWAAAGLASLVLALPMLRDLAAAKQIGGVAFTLHTRDFWPVTKAWKWFGVDLDCGEACRLALLPLNYGLELGFFLFAAPVYWLWRRRQGPLEPEERFLIVATGVSVLVATFLRADIHNNDLGWRAFLFAQFALLLWAVPVARAMFGKVRDGLPEPRRAVSLLLFAALCLGAMENGANYLRNRLWAARPERLEERRVYDWMAAHLPADAVVQGNPGKEIELMAPMHLHRQLAAADTHFTWLYGIRHGYAHGVIDPLARVFDGDPTPEEVSCILRRFGIDVLVATDADLAWQEPRSWVWTAPVLLARPTMRVVAAPR